MLKLSTFRIAQVAIGILLLAVIRTVAALIPITPDGSHSGNLYRVYLIGALIAATAALVCHILYSLGKHRLVLVLAALTIVGLIVFKVVQHA
jgi:hypothetical protein